MIALDVLGVGVALVGVQNTSSGPGETSRSISPMDSLSEALVTGVEAEVDFVEPEAVRIGGNCEALNSGGRLCSLRHLRLSVTFFWSVFLGIW